jgi:hypothetical protein
MTFVACYVESAFGEESYMKLFSTALLMLLITTAVYGADVDGKWTGTIAGPAGDTAVSFTFKADGAKLTGTTVGLDGMDVPIKDGKIDGNNLSFMISLDFGGMPFEISYKGVVASDQIKMTAEFFGMPFDFVVKKAPADAPAKPAAPPAQKD